MSARVTPTRGYATGGRRARRGLQARSPRGFTLVEVVTAIGIAMVVGGLLVKLYLLTQKGVDAQQQKLRQTANVRSILWDLKRDLRSAAEVVPTHAAYNTGSQTVILEVPALDDESRAVANRRDRIIYHSSDDGIRRIVVPDRLSSRDASDSLLTDGSTSLRFEYGGADLFTTQLVTVHVTDERTIARRESTFPASMTVRLRNHP